MKLTNRFGISAAVLAVLILAVLSAGAGGATPAPELAFQNSAAQVLSLKFSSPDISYLLLDTRNRNVIAEQWENSDGAIAVGSLVKPFTAIAYAERHHFRFPAFVCSGAESCWRPRGHGQIGIVHATAVSCNAYFTQLAATLTPAEVAETVQRYGLDGPATDATAEGIAGRHGMWRESPRAVAHAYAELLARRSQPGVRDVAEGMGLAAKRGTAAELSKAVPQIPLLAKTGTAPCTHPHHASGDGFVVVAWPADSPRYLLLMRQHNKPGAQAAVVAGQMLRALEPQ